MSTQADVEQMKVFCAFRCETRSDDQRGHAAERAKVKGQSAVVVCVGESTGAVAAGVFLKRKKTVFTCLLHWSSTWTTATISGMNLVANAPWSTCDTRVLPVGVSSC